MEKERPDRPVDASYALQAPRQAYQFPCWWGGMGVATEPPQIHALLLKLREEVGHLAPTKKDKVPYLVKSGADLMYKLRLGLDRLGMHAPVVAHEVARYEPISGENKYGDPTTTLVVHVRATVRICAPDGSFIDVQGSGHGASEDDKAGGKASTYAWKDAVLKSLTVPEKDMPDTDNESVPLAAKPKGSVVDMWGEAIAKATTVARLDQIKASMAKLPMETQLKLSPAWEAKRKELGEAK